MADLGRGQSQGDIRSVIGLQGLGRGRENRRSTGTGGQESCLHCKGVTPSCTFHQTHGMYNTRVNPTGDYGPHVILMCQWGFANCDTCPSLVWL